MRYSLDRGPDEIVGYDVEVEFHGPKPNETFHWMGSEATCKRKAMLKTLARKATIVRSWTASQWLHAYGDPHMRKTPPKPPTGDAAGTSPSNTKPPAPAMKPRKGPMKDLFGAPIPLPDPALAYPRVPYAKDTPRGYAAPPGTGPAGETCRTCAHSHLCAGNTRNYWKCALIQHRWTRSAGTDIRLKSPACAGWQQHTDLHAGDRILILPTKDQGPRTKDRVAIIRGPSAATGFFEVTLRYRTRKKHVHLPISRIRYIRSAR